MRGLQWHWIDGTEWRTGITAWQAIILRHSRTSLSNVAPARAILLIMAKPTSLVYVLFLDPKKDVVANQSNVVFNTVPKVAYSLHR